MAFSLSLLFFSTLVFGFSLHLSLSKEPPSAEVEALIAIKKELRDPHGIFNTWDASSIDPCAWDMITCSFDGTVSSLGAPGQSLSGTLSGAIANLTNLESVILQNNKISGKIPAQIGLLSKLETLDLSNNGFSEGIPSTMGYLKSIQYLRLNNNSLSGPIPPSLLANLSHITFLDLSYNNLSGPVPMPMLSAGTFNIEGNPLISTSKDDEAHSSSTIPVPTLFSIHSGHNIIRNILRLFWFGVVHVVMHL